MTRLYTLLTTLSFFILFNCSGQEIDRDKAGEMIISYNSYPLVEAITMETDFYCLRLSSWHTAAVQNGYMRKVREYFSVNQNCWNYEYAITPNYDKYIIIEYNSQRKNIRKDVNIAASVLDFLSVTGIKFNGDKTSATVEYMVKRTKITPFGTIAGKTSRYLFLSTTIELYDDGWRITKGKDSYYPYTQSKYPSL